MCSLWQDLRRIKYVDITDLIIWGEETQVVSRGFGVVAVVVWFTVSSFDPRICHISFFRII